MILEILNTTYTIGYSNSVTMGYSSSVNFEV